MTSAEGWGLIAMYQQLERRTLFHYTLAEPKKRGRQVFFLLVNFFVFFWF
jgi:hypothetical protein